jgi:hypothetical protein
MLVARHHVWITLRFVEGIRWQLCGLLEEVPFAILWNCFPTPELILLHGLNHGTGTAEACNVS